MTVEKHTTDVLGMKRTEYRTASGEVLCNLEYELAAPSGTDAKESAAPVGKATGRYRRTLRVLIAVAVMVLFLSIAAVAAALTP
jgi:hypothetical protein